jgi:hypothetical protein
MILLSVCADTLSAHHEWHAKGNGDNEYAEGDNNNKPLDEDSDDKYAKGGWQTITAKVEPLQWEATQDGQQRQ